MTRRVLPLSQVGTIFDGPHATPERVTEGPYFLNIASLQSGRLDLSQSDHVSESNFAAWTRRVTPQQNDLLFSYETRLGEAALMPSGVRACLGRRMALLRPDTSIVDPKFLLYYYLSPELQSMIEQRSIHGATVNRIGLATMGDWEVNLPELSKQRRIAGALGALDDKIAVNAATVTKTEQLCNFLVEGIERQVLLKDIACVSNDLLSPDRFSDSNVWHYSLPAFDEGQRPRREAPDSIKSSKFVLDGPGVLVSKLNPRIPRVWDVPCLNVGQSVASTEFMILTSPVCSSSVLRAVLAQPSFGSTLVEKAAGTSGSHQRVRPQDLLTTAVVDPRAIPDSVRKQVTAIGLLDSQLRLETKELARMRDVLLPELISGRLRVDDAEKQVEVKV